MGRPIFYFTRKKLQKYGIPTLDSRRTTIRARSYRLVDLGDGVVLPLTRNLMWGTTGARTDGTPETCKSMQAHSTQATGIIPVPVISSMMGEIVWHVRSSKLALSAPPACLIDFIPNRTRHFVHKKHAMVCVHGYTRAPGRSTSGDHMCRQKVASSLFLCTSYFRGGSQDTKK